MVGNVEVSGEPEWLRAQRAEEEKLQTFEAAWTVSTPAVLLIIMAALKISESSAGHIGSAIILLFVSLSGAP